MMTGKNYICRFGFYDMIRVFANGRFPRLLVSILVMVFVIAANQASGQEKKIKLQNDKKKLEEEIRYTNRLIEDTKESKKNTLDHLILLNRRITKREALISTYGKQLEEIDGQIMVNNDAVKNLSGNLKTLKDEYARMIYYAYKNRNIINRLMFVFSSEDFNQAYRRMKYFQQYSVYRKVQAELIVKAQNDLNQAIVDLEKQKEEKLSLLSQKEKEKIGLTLEKEEQNKVVKQLGKKEKELLATLREKESAARKLQKEIEKIIAEEIKASGNMESTAGTYMLTPEERVISGNFEANISKLPWPLERGVVSTGFGEQPHPVLKNVKIKNNGIDILTDQGSVARSVFEGTVTRVMSVPNYNYVIMIRHGEFLSIYSNLKNVLVKKGDKIQMKQNLGTVYTDSREDKTELHFELWQGKKILNPEDWLAGKG